MHGHLKEILKLQLVQSRQQKGEKIKQVTKFKHLGYLITSDRRRTSEISKRLATAKDTFQKKKPVLTKKNISMDTRITVMKYGQCYYTEVSVGQYARKERELEAVEMWFIRRMMRSS
ncbi:endonuclease-reverse transcriptase [Plakobranchus ocellatus]|uniref:Endonuclease-reverse transcriptase n=1 Tax=Plakobranchus ocellatus TaxID=259542 RepID=A0AAV4CYJ4_9GAST|nr:endonuclease-reverse transcriptase [Plakobranchus ocellatus]